MKSRSPLLFLLSFVLFALFVGHPLPAGATETPPAETSALLEALPGGELLSGATSAGASDFEGDDQGLPSEWTPENAAEEPAPAKKEGEEEEEEKPEGEAKPAEVPAPAPEASAIPADWPAEAKTRIETAEKEREALKGEKETLAKEVETLRATTAPRLAATPDSPLAGVHDLKDIDFHTSLARELKTFCTRSLVSGGEMPRELQAKLDGVKPEEITEPRQFTPEDAANFLARADTMLEQHIPARRDYLTRETQSASSLQQDFPEFLDPKTESGKMFSAFESQFPQIKSFPHWRQILAATVRGQIELNKEFEARKAAKTSTATPIAPVPPKTGATTTPASKSSKPKKGTPELSASMDARELAAALT